AVQGVATILETLHEPDRFAVYAFDDRVEHPDGFERGRLYPADADHRAAAVEFLGRLTPRGGTEMAELLELTADALTDPEHDRSAFLLTDGQSGNEEQILRNHGDGLLGVRVFALGIDRSVRGAFLRQLASLGGGAFEVVDSPERLHDALRRFHRRIATPLLTGLRLQTDGFQIVE